jgi:hypothetical protein
MEDFLDGKLVAALLGGYAPDTVQNLIPTRHCPYLLG